MANIDKITFSRLCEIMEQYNKEYPQRHNGAYLKAAIVFKESNWDHPYTEKERTYYVSNGSKFFIPGMLGNSLFGDCADGRDIGVRLDWYNWDIDYCYLLN